MNAAIATETSAARLDATTFDGLSRMAFHANWNPDQAVDWTLSPDLAETLAAPWIRILHYFYEGEWQGLQVIERLMDPAAKRYGLPEMTTYYATQCYDEAKHLYVFRKYLERLGSPPEKVKAFDPIMMIATHGPWKVERWILATWFTETLAGTIFQTALDGPIDPLGKDLISWMLKDETRHIAGTRLSLEVVFKGLRPGERAILGAWWRAFRSLAVKEVKKLGPDGAPVGLPADRILAILGRRMRDGAPVGVAAWLGLDQAL